PAPFEEEERKYLNAPHPRSPAACALPPSSQPRLRTLTLRWSRTHSSHDHRPLTLAAPPRLSGMLRGRALAVNRPRAHMVGLDRHSSFNPGTASTAATRRGAQEPAARTADRTRSR